MPSSPSVPAHRSLIESSPLRAVSLVSLAVLLYFLLLGYFGDDYSFHLSSWIGILEGWRSGTPAPSWFAQANFGLGEPRFYFYPPLSVFCGALLLSVFPERIVPALMPWLATLVSGLSMLKLARSLQPERATRSALLYITSYYIVITIIMRYAIGELFVAAVLPLIVLYALRLFTTGHRYISLTLTLLLAFTWLTNVPSALVVFYILLFASMVLSATQRSPRPLLVYLLAQALAIGLAAWYLVPAAMANAQLTTTSLAAKFPWRDYTLFHHPHNPLARSMTWPLWIWAIVGFLFVLSTAIRHHRSPSLEKAESSPWTFIASLGCLPLLFELPQAGLLWNGLPALKLVAFSVRFLPFLAIALSLLVPGIRTPSLRRFAYALWIVWMLLPVAERIGRSCVHGAPQTYASLATEIRHSTGGMSEYLPAGLRTSPESPADAASLHQDLHACATSTLSWKPESRKLTSHGQQACIFEPGFYFPEWLATVDGRPVAVQRSPAGLAQVSVPAGEHLIEVYFQRPRTPLLLGAGITLLTIALLFSSPRWS